MANSGARGGALLPAYLIVGGDQLKCETAVSRLKGRLEPGLEVFNLDERTAASDMDPTSIAISLNTVPVGNGFRLVLVHDANKLPKAVSETIISYLANPNPGCVACLTAEKLAKNTRLYKAVAKVGKRAVIDCTPIRPRDIPSYLVKHAAAKGIVLDIDAARELQSRVGESTTLLDRQLTNLGELCAQTRHVTLRDVRSHVARTAEVKPWEFLDAVAAGRASVAMELYRHMQNPSQLALLALLTRRIRELICAHELAGRGQSARVAAELGRQDWQVRSVVQSARRFTSEQLSACLASCAACERRIKGGFDADAEFVRTVLFICDPTLGA